MCEPTTIGQWLEQLRTRRSLSRTELAEAMEVSYNTVLAWENGQNDVSRHVVNQLVEKFGVSEGEHLKALKLPREAAVAA